MTWQHDRTLAVLDAEFADDAHAADLLATFLSATEYSQSVAYRLIETARRRTASWRLRRVAVLMLEHTVLKLSAHDVDEFENLSERMGIQPALSTTKDIERLLKRLARLNRIHCRINGVETPQEAWQDFLHAARADSKLTLARYLFSPDEVIREIRRRVAISSGLSAAPEPTRVWYNNESERALSHMPPYEQAIARGLFGRPDVYWVAPSVPSALNSLAEYPLGSAALVVKPPGSDIEFEIKRAGIRGRLPLTIIAEENGEPAPLSHRFHGGALGWLIRREADAAVRFSAIYRMIHGAEAPISTPLTLTSVRTISVDGQEIPLLNYLTNPRVFGPGFPQMRAAMRKAIDAFRAHSGAQMLRLPGDHGLTLQFIAQVSPLQIALANTTSFRLDRISTYLSETGPEEYFTKGLGVPYDAGDARRLADDVLETILGVYDPPDCVGESYKEYVETALSIPANRERADRALCAVMQQIGECWGTLIAIGGYSDGESFVSRNVGLRSCWSGDDWTVGIVFMDHDDLSIPGHKHKRLHPRRAVQGMYRDHVHVLGGRLDSDPRPGEVTYLLDIYRPSPEQAAASVEILRAATRAARRKTEQQLAGNAALQQRFHDSFLRSLRDWNELVGERLHGPRLDGWKDEVKWRLRERSYDEELVQEYATVLERFEPMLKTMAWLHED